MLKRDCWQARSNWSAEISMALARLSWALLCSMMIRPLLLAHWTKRHPRISGLVEARKQIGCPGSCARDIPITPAVDLMSLPLPYGQRGARLLNGLASRFAERSGYRNTIASAQLI